MYFTFACPHCNKKLKVREEAAGRKASCPYCKTSVVVPRPPATSEADQAVAALRGIGETAQTDKLAGRARRKTPPPTPKEEPAGGATDRGEPVHRVLLR